MSAQYSGLIVELSANASIPGKQLGAIMTAYPTCWGYAAPVKDKKTGATKLLMAATKIPQGFSPKDIQDMKAELHGTPEMMEFFGKFPDNVDDVCMQPFPLLEDDKGNTTLCLFMEGDYDHWSKEDELNLSPEYICYRDKISPLVNKLNDFCKGDISQLVKELGGPVVQEILEGTFADRGVMYFLADNGASQMIEGGNDKRKDEDWGSVSNEVPEVKEGTSPEPKEEPADAQPTLSLAEKRKLRQQGKEPATQTATKPAIQQKDTTLSEQQVKDTLKSSTAEAPKKGPFLFTLPVSIKTEAEALLYWKSTFGTCPDNWKHKLQNGTWTPSYSAGFPYEKSTKGSIIREKYNPDGTPKSASKGFAALDNVATGKTDTATAKSPQDGDTRPASAPNKLPIMPVAVRDKVIADIVKLDLKSRPIASNDEIKAVEAKHSTLFEQLNKTPIELLWRMSYEEIDKFNRTYPDFGSVWLFSLRNFQILNWKTTEKPKEEETATEAVHEPELTLAQKRAARKKAAA